MSKLLPALSLLLAPLATFAQARLVINGTTQVAIVENGGTNVKPIYLEVANPAANAITVNGTHGWIVSESEFNMIKWDISNQTGAYTVPFGSAGAYTAFPKPNGGIGAYIPLTATINTAGSAGGSIKFSTYHTLNLNSSYMPSDVTNMGPIYPLTSSPSTVDDSYYVVDRFWIMDTYLTGPNTYVTKPAMSQVQFTYLSSGSGFSEIGVSNIFAENSLLAQRWNPSLAPKTGWGDFLGVGGTDPGGGGLTNHASSGTVTSGNFFRSWTLSSQNSPLPIQISSFTGTCSSGAALIQWTSQSELNNDYYTVKKTNDNVHFETVGTVKGAGTTSMSNNYSLTDNSPYPGTSYYYLYQTDFDNNTNLVGSIPFTGCATPTSTSVTAFNTSSYIQVEINSIASDNFNISLTNLLGQTILNENHSVSLGNNVIQLNNVLSSGIYILNVKNDKVNFTKKLVIGVK